MSTLETSPRPQGNGVWFAVSLGLIGVIVGYSLAIFTGGASRVAQAPSPTAPTPTSAAPTQQPSGPVAEVTAKDHKRGPANAKITIITYTDFQCPYCKRAHTTMEEVLAAYKNDVNLVYRNFPLSFHEYAQKLAEGSECVAELAGNDAFWKYSDKVFGDTTTQFTNEEITKVAVSVGADQAKFKTCLESSKYAAKVQSDEDGGAAAGVRGTPANFLYNNATKKTQLISGAQPLENFKTAIDAMLAGK
ncbi:MAG: thioredoxin domain-containing protein [Candidatus Peribacteraceae bacterium]